MSKMLKLVVVCVIVNILLFFLGFIELDEYLGTGELFASIGLLAMGIIPMGIFFLYLLTPEYKERKEKERLKEERKEFYRYLETKTHDNPNDVFENISLYEEKYLNETAITTKSVFDFPKIERPENGYEFEIYIAYLLNDLGFDNVLITPSSGDFGADVLAENLGVRYAIQAKYHSQPVGNKAVQEVFTAKKHYNANIAVVVTNNVFTKSAITQAKSTGVLLWDGYQLNDMINKVK